MHVNAVFLSCNNIPAVACTAAATATAVAVAVIIYHIIFVVSTTMMTMMTTSTTMAIIYIVVVDRNNVDVVCSTEGLDTLNDVAWFQSSAAAAADAAAETSSSRIETTHVDPFDHNVWW